MDFAIECPINTVSLGQVSICILREFYKKGIRPNIFPISSVDLSSCTRDEGFDKWLNECINSAPSDLFYRYFLIKIFTSINRVN